MKIAFVSYDFGEYSVRHANALAEHAEVLLVLADDVAQEHVAMLSDAVELYQFQKPRLRQPLKQYRSIRKVLRRIHAFGPDIVHFQGGHLWFNFALLRLRRYPLVLTVHNPRHHIGDQDSRRTPQSVMDFGYRRADRIIVHGDLLKRQVTEELGIAPNHVHVIAHIVMGDCSHDINVQEDGNLVLFFGRIWEYKGLEYLIRAEPLISSQVPKVRIMIVGRGEDFDRYRRLMMNPERFEVINRHVSNEERERYFAESAIVVLPYISATQSGVVPVAYTHSKPVVATTVGSLQEFVDDGKTGLLVPPANEHALADAIVKLLQDEPLRHKLGKQGRAKLDAECTADIVARKHLEVYRAAMRRRGSQAPTTSHNTAIPSES